MIIFGKPGKSIQAKIDALEKLQKSKQLNSCKEKEIKKEIYNYDRGLTGERENAESLYSGCEGNPHIAVINDFCFKMEGKNKQIDHLIFHKNDSTKGYVFSVLESKNYKKLRVEKNGECFVQKKNETEERDVETKISSPFSQVEEQKEALEKLFKEKKIAKGISVKACVLINYDCDLDIDDESKNCPIKEATAFSIEYYASYKEDYKANHKKDYEEGKFLKKWGLKRLAKKVNALQIDGPSKRVKLPQKDRKLRIKNLPENILSAWTSIEVLSPVKIKESEKKGLLEGEKVPWEGDGEKPKDKKKQLYYEIILGTISLESANTEIIKKYKDTRVEAHREKGDAILATIILDQEGKLIGKEGIAVSSYGWGVVQVMKENLDELGDWLHIKSNFIKGLQEIIYTDRPLTMTDINNAYKWLVEEISLPDNLRKPSCFAIKVERKISPRPRLMSSFFLSDLAKAKELFAKNSAPNTLKYYLETLKPESKTNLVENNVLEDSVAPSLFPPARWPGFERHSLTLLQQAAVNLAVNGPKEESILAINGPPGTGKTTLLRDIVASIVVDRALQLMEFKDPKDAFINKQENVKVGGYPVDFCQLNPKVRGFEILVVSSNNNAVENISIELPEIEAIAKEEPEIRYFKEISDALPTNANAKRKTWGLIAAALGKKSNCYDFKKGFWWDEKAVGLNSYLSAVSSKKHEDVLKRWEEARNEFKEAVACSKKKLQEYEEIRRNIPKLSGLEKDEKLAVRRLEAREKKAPVVLEDIQKTKDSIHKSMKNLAGNFIDETFFKQKESEQYKCVPWLNEETQQKRDAVFVKAMALHKAFIDAAAEPLGDNLEALMNVFAGDKIIGKSEQALLPDLWASLFLVVPVISTTFSSVDRMLGHLPPEALGWLLIDEAGQALPQAAIGALRLARRAIVVGDPMQLEPIVNLPNTLTEDICKHFEVSPNVFNAPKASTQTLANAATRYCAKFKGENRSRRTGGVPLLVHRRCSEPMFSISNSIAYSGTMVQSKTEGVDNSLIKNVLGGSGWFDVTTNNQQEPYPDGKWSQEEGELVIKCLQNIQEKAKESNTPVPDLYVITPFKDVQENMETMIKEKGINWLKKGVGTLHAVQGKEAEAVILVLGAQSPKEYKARGWAGKSPNLLNIAVTRAKKIIYVVGNRELWKKEGVFKKLDEELSSKMIAEGELLKL